MLQRVMAGQFKPVRFSVLIGLAAILMCGVAVLYTHRMAHGTTAEERAAYESDENVEIVEDLQSASKVRRPMT